MAFPTYGKNLLAAYREQPAPLMRRTDMESGPSKQARIARRRLVPRSCSYQYTQAEYAQFKAWVDSEGAVNWFDWIDPFDGSTKQARLQLGQYEARPVSAGAGRTLDWIVTLTLETYE